MTAGRMSGWSTSLISGFLIAGITACAAPIERSSPENGARLFAANCAACHGADARGRGSAPDLTRLKMGTGGVFPTIEVLSQIHDGSEGMPGFGALDLGDTVVVEIEDGLGTPVQADLLALWSYLDTLQASEAQPR